MAVVLQSAARLPRLLTQVAAGVGVSASRSLRSCLAADAAVAAVARGSASAHGDVHFIAADFRTPSSSVLDDWRRQQIVEGSQPRDEGSVTRIALVRNAYAGAATDAGRLPFFCPSGERLPPGPLPRDRAVVVRGEDEGVILVEEWLAINANGDNDESHPPGEMHHRIIKSSVGTGESLVDYMNKHGYIVHVDDSVGEGTYTPPTPRQSARDVLMVAPTAFMSNTETAADNHFMHEAKFGDAAGVEGASTAEEMRRKVLREHSGLFRALHGAGVNVHLFNHEAADETPDAVFPNNWFSTCRKVSASPTPGSGDPRQKSKLVLYPMLCPSRQRERRQDIIGYLKTLHRYDKTFDLAEFATDESGRVTTALEGTGSLVLDHINRIAYAAISDRTDERLLDIWATKAYQGYKVVKFSSVDRDGKPIYHTNVVCALGTGFAVICSDTIKDDAERSRVLDAMVLGKVDSDGDSSGIALTGHTRDVIDINVDKMESFCGNILEVEGRDGQLWVVMSTKAYNAFSDAQKEQLTKRGEKIIHVPFDVIEKVGGGGVRCAIAASVRHR